MILLLILTITALLAFAAGWWLGCRELKRVWFQGWEEGRAWGALGRNLPGDPRC